VAKGPEAFRTISEAADELGVAQHVLRFWETKFSFIKPMKRAGGRRFYRPADIVMLAGVRRQLHHEGLTIKALQRLYREKGVKGLVADALAQDFSTRMSMTEPSRAKGDVSSLKAALHVLEAAKGRLEGLLKR